MIAPQKGFRTPADFIAGATEQPASVIIDPTAPSKIVTVGGDNQPAAAEQPNVEQPQAATAAIVDTGASIEEKTADTASSEQPTAPAQGPRPSRQTKPKATPANSRVNDDPLPQPQAPWDNESPDIKGPGYQYRFDRQLHAKLQWISDNVPQHKSIQVVIDKAVRGYVAEMISKHYKPSGDE